MSVKKSELPCPNLVAGTHVNSKPQDCMLCFGTNVMTILDGKLVNMKTNKIACSVCFGDGYVGYDRGRYYGTPCPACGTMGDYEGAQRIADRQLAEAS
jgi:hypothetical protein